ncbi:DEAD/DEAH box helicase [Umboniibacter marinipuniceus]|uniref:ATP-dependent RNA helicase DeaD n=1 Tax=Umboniibacter marinipuniceus TaxID=569599 RepID=A0A3M0A4E2_9GAMM|nr:DEAD/DEAH box helicase [Umboniibacter marinipuniceus]RMA80041.1 ATP-dependent RNA helicase CsdA [Umboniibacter marinipuniceus]
MSESNITFDELGLSEQLLKEIKSLGYEKPSPIQERAIPVLLDGRDILGQAQTGTGKTAAFALPLIDNLDLKANHIQVLVLTPTRELAIQVAEAFQRYAASIRGFRVLPIYGGQPMNIQMRGLQRGAQVVVGTPGRVIDHLNRGSLKLDKLQALVLDEADEMLNMGFLEDVEKVMEFLPEERQIALFSATMPKAIESVAKKYLRNPEHIEIAGAKRENKNIKQYSWVMKNDRKRDALTRLLESEEYDAAIIFVRTRVAADELTMILNARGYRCSALQGDMAQKQREQAVNSLKKGQLDIIIATDVAARGLDVERISLVINYDIPYDVEAYVHRIGRTGRAGREGTTVLFSTPRERRMQQAIERHLKIEMLRYQLPSGEDIAERRVQQLIDDLKGEFEKNELSDYEAIGSQLLSHFEMSPEKLLAALLRSQSAQRPLLAPPQIDFNAGRDSGPSDRGPRDRGDRGNRGGDRGGRPEVALEAGFKRYRLDVGHNHQVKPGNIVGAIANEGNINAKSIGRVQINEGYTLVDLPDDLPKELERHLQNTRVCGRPIKLREWTDKPGQGRGGKPAGRARPGGKPKGRANSSRPSSPRRSS